MKNSLQDFVAGIPIRSEEFRVDRSLKRYLPDPADSVPNRKNKASKKGDSFAHGVREHGK
jgi:hypothetical protein